MMAFQDLKASPFGDLLNNPSGWTAKGGQPGDARGIVPAHVKGSTPGGTPEGRTQPENTPDDTQAEAPDGRTPENTPGSTPENASGGTQVEMPEERTPDSTPDKPSEGGAAEATGSAEPAGPMDSIPEATKPVDSTPDAPTDTAESTPPDKPQAEGDKEAPATPEDTQRDRTEEAEASSSPDTQPAENAPDETDSTSAEAPEAARIPDRAAARERLLKELEDRPELADAFLKMFSLMPEAPGTADPVPETLQAEEAKAPAEGAQRPSDDVSDSSKELTPMDNGKAVTDESTKSLDLSPAIDAAIRKSLRDIFASRHKGPAPAPVDAMPSLPDSDDPLQILSAAMEPVEQARAAKEEETKVDQLLTLEQLTRNELIAMEAVLKELRTLARRQEVHLSLNRGAVKNGLTEVRQNLSDFREFLSTKSEPTEEDAEAETPAEVSLADLAERIDYLQTVLEQLPAHSEKPVEPLPDAKALKASYDETLEQMAHIPNELDEGIQKVLGNAQRQVDRYCTKFLSVHKKEDTPLRKALPFIAAFLGGFLGALVVGQALFH